MGGWGGEVQISRGGGGSGGMLPRENFESLVCLRHFARFHTGESEEENKE